MLSSKEGVPHVQKITEPEEAYGKTLNAMARIWKYLGNYGGYRGSLPGPETDIELLVIDKNWEYWLRILKGLDRQERAILISQVTQLNRLLLGFVRKSMEILKDEDADGKRGMLGK